MPSSHKTNYYDQDHLDDQNLKIEIVKTTNL